MTFYSLNKLEERFRQVVSERAIRYQLRARGIDVIIVRVQEVPSASIQNHVEEAKTLSQDAFNVFGDYSGVAPVRKEVTQDLNSNGVEDTNEKTIEFMARVVIAKIPLNPIDAANTGALEQHVVYTEAVLEPNDRIKIPRPDGTFQSGIIGQKLAWGITSEVYNQYELNNFADALA